MALQSFNAIVTLPLLILGALWAGLLGAAYATLTAAALGVIFDLFLGLPLLSLSPFTLLGAIWRSLVAGAMMVAAVLTLAAYWQTDLATGSMLLLIMYATVGAVTYSVGVFFLWLWPACLAEANTYDNTSEERVGVVCSENARLSQAAVSRPGRISFRANHYNDQIPRSSA